MSETPSIMYGRGSNVLDYRGRVRAAWIKEGRWSHRFAALTPRVCCVCIGKRGDAQHV